MRLIVEISKWLARFRPFRGWSHETTKEKKNVPSIILTLPDGRKLTAEDLRGHSGMMTVRQGKLLEVAGNIRYEIIGKDNVSGAADSLHQQAREAGAHGDYKTAIRLLEQASELAPTWPYPLYDGAFTYLMMKDFDSARTYYRRTLELSPRGFFTAITALDTLTREQNGDLPVGTYLAYLSLEWMKDKGQKENAIRELVKRIPQFAPAWKELASLCDDDVERRTAIENGLAANPDVDTKGILNINKALVLNLWGDHAAALQMLGELPLDPASTFRTEHSARAALSILTVGKTR
jgi:tetratricopeptide (TPR) repeat protein